MSILWVATNADPDDAVRGLSLGAEVRPESHRVSGEPVGAVGCPHITAYRVLGHAGWWRCCDCGDWLREASCPSTRQ